MLSQPATHLYVNVHLLLLVTVDHGSILDDEPILGALEVDGDLLDRGDHAPALSLDLGLGVVSGQSSCQLRTGLDQ